MLKIPVNTELAFLYDESIICHTVGTINKVMYAGTPTTLSKLAVDLGWTGSSVNGSNILLLRVRPYGIDAKK